MDRQAVHDDMERARVSFLGSSTLLPMPICASHPNEPAGTTGNRCSTCCSLLDYPSPREGVRRATLWCRTGFRAGAQAATTPFDLVNYAGSYLGRTVLTRKQTASRFDRVIAALHRRLDAEIEADLARGMHYPTLWDPFFQEFMTHRRGVHRVRAPIWITTVPGDSHAITETADRTSL